MVQAPRRGHVYGYRGMGFRVLVLSDDLHNEKPYTNRVLVVPISRHGTDDHGNEVPYAVNISDASAVSGYVRVAQQFQVDPVDLVAPGADEMLSGADLDNVKRVNDEFLGYY